MDKLIEKIEETVIALLQYDMEKYPLLVQELADLMALIFPAVIDCYNDPRMKDLQEDAAYWPGQLERVVNSLNTGDHFEVADVLYNETHANLVELRGILVQRGLL